MKGSVVLLFFFFMPPSFSMGVCVWGGGGGGEHIVSPLSVRPVRNTNGFRGISFDKIGVLD